MQAESLTKKDYEAALKKISGKSPVLMQVELPSDRYKLILPHKAGVELMQLLDQAYLLREYYSTAPELRELDDEFKFTTMSSEKLADYKVAVMLNISMSELQDIKKQPS